MTLYGYMYDQIIHKSQYMYHDYIDLARPEGHPNPEIVTHQLPLQPGLMSVRHQLLMLCKITSVTGNADIIVRLTFCQKPCIRQCKGRVLLKHLPTYRHTMYHNTHA